jgi:anti-anti-sigma factor
VHAIDGSRAEAVRAARIGLCPEERWAVTVRPVDELDLFSGLRLLDVVDAIEGSGDSLHVRIALDEVTFIDVAGLRALFRCRDLVRSRGGTVVLAEPSAAVRRLLSVLPDLSARFEEE